MLNLTSNGDGRRSGCGGDANASTTVDACCKDIPGLSCPSTRLSLDVSHISTDSFERNFTVKRTMK